jgi:hypothetical protein
MALHVRKEDGGEMVLCSVDEYISASHPDGWDADPARAVSLRNSVYNQISRGSIRTAKAGARRIIVLEV